MFYSEGGPDCLMDKKEAIQHCLNTSFSKYMPAGPESGLSHLPEFKFEEEQCKYVWLILVGCKNKYVNINFSIFFK